MKRRSEVDRLVVALRQALDEEERMATWAASGSQWTADLTGPLGPGVRVASAGEPEWSREVNVQIWTCDDEQDECPDMARAWSAEAKHIARHDPARVLRQVAAHRAILDRHEPSPWVRDLSYCSWCSDKRGDSIEDWPCPDFLALVEIYGVSTAREAQVTEGA